MLIQEVAEVENDSTLADAQEIGAQLQSAMEDLYYAHRMGNPNPTVKQNIDMLQKSIRSFNQELNALGYKYAPTVPGLVARMGTRFVEADAKIFHPQYVDVYFLDGARRTPILVNKKVPYNLIDRYLELVTKKYNLQQGRFEFRNAEEDLAEFAPTKPPTGGAGGPKDYGQPTSSRYIGGNKFVVGTTNNYVLTATIDKWGLEWDEDDEIWFLDSPGAAHIADATEGEIELPAPQEQRYQIHDLVTDYLNGHNSAELQKVAAYYGHSADGEMSSTLAEFALPGGDDREPDEEHILKQLAAQWWLGTEQQMARAQQTLAAMGWEIGQDESGDDDAGVFVIRVGDEHGDSYIAFPHSELNLDEGIRVPGQQILGTKNRAKSAYYPTNVKPKVPRLDTPLTDKEITRLTQLAGVNPNK